jgi:multiphosphoryl transfer protein
VSAPLALLAPLPGWCMPLAEVPDAVFAQGLAGDGVAIDPIAGVLVAPCEGEIVPMQGIRHAVTLRTAIGVDVLIHVGIDTVGLGGEGFELLVRAGERVRAGQELMRFDLDRLARRVPSLATPMVLPAGGLVVRRVAGRAVKAGELLMEIVAGAAEAVRAEGVGEIRRELAVAFDHGLHVRPAAQVVAALRPFAAEVSLDFRGRSASARSTVAMMSLGAQRGDVIQACARGADAAQALDALAALLPAAERPASQAMVARVVAAGTDLRRIDASIASRGIAIGRVVAWAQPDLPVAEQGADEAGERAALDRAIAQVRRHLEAAGRAAGGERGALLAAHSELAGDPELRSRADEWLRRGKSAAYAWRRATRSVAESLAALEDARMRERAADLRDIECQVLHVLAGHDPGAVRRFDPGAIVVAGDLPPSAVLAMERGAVGGICTARGGPTSHVAILAAAAGIPALVAAGPRVLELAEGTPVVLDAEHGWLDVDPPQAEIAAIERAVAQREQERAADAGAAMAEARTRDGVRVRVNANLGSLDEAAPAVESGAEGCGLLRTEFLYLDRAQAPGEDEQAAEYQRIATALAGRPLAIRTLDPGGDKPIAYLPMPHEDNPALGMRGLRASLWAPQLLRAQLRAILRVRPAGQCRILLPMVTDAEEVRAIRSIALECAGELGMAELPALGAMIETPAAALLAESLAEAADFLSIGSNDLAQYTLAIDRGHPELARRLDALHPAVLRLIALVAEAAAARAKPVSLCGALASDVDALPILIGLGVLEISAAPAMIPRLKRTARALDAAQCREAARRALELATAAEVRDLAAVARAKARAASEAHEGGKP